MITLLHAHSRGLAASLAALCIATGFCLPYLIYILFDFRSALVSIQRRGLVALVVSTT